MKKFMAVMVLACFLVGLLAVGAGGEEDDLLKVITFCSGNKYLKAPNSFKEGYILGAMDMLLAFDGFYRGGQLNKRVEHMTGRQLQAIVEKYLKDNPQRWHYSMANLMILAIEPNILTELTKPKMQQ